MTIQEFAYLNQRHHSEFRGLALTLTRDEDRARDLLQDATYLILKHRDSFQPGSSFVAWVKTIIRNTFISEYRRGKRRAELIEKRQPNETWIGDHAVPNPAESNLGAEDIIALIDDLPKAYRRAFRLYFNGIKYREIAQLTGVPVGTAKSRVFMARKLLKTSLRSRGIR